MAFGSSSRDPYFPKIITKNTDMTQYSKDLITVTRMNYEQLIKEIRSTVMTSSDYPTRPASSGGGNVWYDENNNIFYVDLSIGWTDIPYLTLAGGTMAGGLDMDGNGIANASSVQAETFESTVATGTAPFTVDSVTLVANLNADLLDDEDGSYYLDSDNFTGTDWTDLTDGGATTLHTHTHDHSSSSGSFTIGSGANGVDYYLEFNGHAGDGRITWMEDEDYFESSDDVLLNSNEKIYFRDTDISVSSVSDGYLNLAADSGIRIGDATPTNYTQFDGTGHQTMVGSAKPWDDLRIEPVARTTGANAPTFAKWYDNVPGSSRGVYLYTFDDAAAGSEKEIHFTMQMPHSWDGGSIYLHVHWVGAVADTSSAPRWGLEYIWKDVGQVFGDTTTVYSDGNNYHFGGNDTDITAHKHYISKFAALVPGSSADDISSILIGRLFRDSADGGDTYNAPGADCGLLYIDAHFQINSLGSTDEYAK